MRPDKVRRHCLRTIQCRAAMYRHWPIEVVIENTLFYLHLIVGWEEFTRSLIFRYNKPIVSTSANISGEPSPHFFGEISEEIKNAVDYIVDYRRNDHKPAAPSSIIKLGMGGEIQIIRK